MSSKFTYIPKSSGSMIVEDLMPADWIRRWARSSSSPSISFSISTQDAAHGLNRSPEDILTLNLNLQPAASTHFLIQLTWCDDTDGSDILRYKSSNTKTYKFIVPVNDLNDTFSCYLDIPARVIRWVISDWNVPGHPFDDWAMFKPLNNGEVITWNIVR